MKLMRYKAQDEGQGSHCGTYTVLLVSEGRKFAHIVYIDAAGLSRTRVPVGDVDRWMTPLNAANSHEAGSIRWFLKFGKRAGISKVLKNLLQARLVELKGDPDHG